MPPGAKPAFVPLPFEPAPAFLGAAVPYDGELAQCHSKRIGTLIVAYNALTTLTKVLKRITPNVWQNARSGRV